MKKLGASAFAGLLLIGMSAFADDKPKDQMGHESMKNDKMMTECMAKMTAKKDGMTHEQMHAACMAEMKSMGKDNTDKPKR
jgi:pentapeptide MXKDX repeat protein